MEREAALKRDKEKKKTWKDVKSVAAAKKAGDLYYKDPKTGKMMIAAYAEDLKGFVGYVDKNDISAYIKKIQKFPILSHEDESISRSSGRRRKGSES